MTHYYLECTTQFAVANFYKALNSATPLGLRYELVLLKRRMRFHGIVRDVVVMYHMEKRNYPL